MQEAQRGRCLTLGHTADRQEEKLTTSFTLMYLAVKTDDAPWAERYGNHLLAQEPVCLFRLESHSANPTGAPILSPTRCLCSYSRPWGAHPQPPAQLQMESHLASLSSSTSTLHFSP